jgi:hypothetical protein
MKKTILLVSILLISSCIIKGQKSSLSIKGGITNCITKTMQVDAPYPFTYAGFDPRTGGLLGARYDYKLSRYFRVGGELLYLLKGYTTIAPNLTKTFSNHYLNLSPFISIYPFANSGNKYISCISPELSFDYNYSIGTNTYFKLASNAKFYEYELGYTMKLTYQPDKFGVQLFYSRSISPFVKTQWGPPPFDDYKYSFVSGVSILYKIFTPHSKP